MDYTQAGYDEFLSRVPPAPSGELDPLQQDQYSPEISGSKVQGGVMETADGKTQLNLEQGFFGVNDGATQVVRLGVQEDGTIGLVIKDREGNVLLQFTGEVNVIQSPNQNFQADFNEERIVAKENGKTLALFGRHQGGF